MNDHRMSHSNYGILSTIGLRLIFLLLVVDISTSFATANLYFGINFCGSRSLPTPRSLAAADDLSILDEPEDLDGSLRDIPDLELEEEVDVAIVGAGIGGLCAGAILNTLYGKKVAVYESHYLPGGCAHAFDRKATNGMTFKFDSGPTILLG
jgi:hypothetical protein